MLPKSLFASRIAPTVAANTISVQKAKRLFQAIREILAIAVERGGTALRDFSSADGMPGHFQSQTQVYDRAGFALYPIVASPSGCCGKASAARTTVRIVKKLEEIGNCATTRTKTLALYWRAYCRITLQRGRDVGPSFSEQFDRFGHWRKGFAGQMAAFSDWLAAQDLLDAAVQDHFAAARGPAARR